MSAPHSSEAEDMDKEQLERDVERVKGVLLETQTAAFNAAQAYTNVIIFGGYAALFAIWTLTKDFLSKEQAFLAGLLLGISVLTYVLYEIFGMLFRAKELWRVRSLLAADFSPAEFLVAHQQLLRSTNFRMLWIALPVWGVAFAVAVLTGIGAAVVLFTCFVRALYEGFI
jgi:hypothetical protein